MRATFLAFFGFLVLLSVWAVAHKPAAAPKGRIVLTWVVAPAPSREFQMQQFRAFAAAHGHPEVDIRLDPDNGGMDKIVVQSVGGIGPDIFDMYQADQLHAFVETGIPLDVTDAAKQRGFSVDRMWPALRKVNIVDGRQYSVPTNCSPSAIFYNKSLFDKYGVPYPKGDWTWEEFVRTARCLTVKRKGGRGYESFGLMGLTPQECIWQAGGRFFSEDGLRCTLDTPQAIEGAQFYIDLQQKYHVMPTAAEEAAMSSTGGWGTGALNYFMGGHIAMMVSGRFAILNFRNVPDLRLAVAPLPYHRAHANRLFWRCSAINRNSPHADTALLFLQFLTSPEYCRGINESGDGISSIPAYDYTQDYLHDPRHPEETDNKLWLDAMKDTRDVEVSPYINSFAAYQIINGHFDLMRNGQETPPVAMRRAATEINHRIAQNIERDPLIRRRFLSRPGSTGNHPATATR